MQDHAKVPSYFILQTNGLHSRATFTLIDPTGVKNEGIYEFEGGHDSFDVHSRI